MSDLNPEDAKKLLLEHIIGLQKELQDKREELAKAIAVQKLIETGVLFPDYEPNNIKLARRAQMESIADINTKNTTQKNTIENQLEEQRNLIETIKQNLIDLENKLARWQLRYDRHYKWWKDDDRPLSAGIAPSPRPRDPSPNPNIDGAAAFPNE